MALDALAIIRRRIGGLFTRLGEIGERLRVDASRFLQPPQVEWQQTTRTNRLLLPNGTTSADLASIDIAGRGEPYQVVVKGTPISNTPSGYNTVDVDPSEFEDMDTFMENLGLSLADLVEVRFDRG